MQNSRGIFISFEGGEGAGKSVQILRLREKLEKQGKSIIVTREPGGTVISEQIRDVVLSKKNVGVAYTTEVLLFQAARAQVYREIIIPSLQVGKWVLADRTSDSSIVYQGMVRGFGVDKIKMLNDLSTQETYPDLTVLLDVPVEVGLARRNGTNDTNRLDLENKEFHEKVRQAYLELAKSETKRWVIVDASRSIDDVAQDVWKIVEERFLEKTMRLEI